MRRGTCPKCGYSRVWQLPGRDDQGLNAGTHTVDLSGEEEEVPLDTYVCLTCGYVELYVADKGDLAKIHTG